MKYISTFSFFLFIRILKYLVCIQVVYIKYQCTYISVLLRFSKLDAKETNVTRYYSAWE